MNKLAKWLVMITAALFASAALAQSPRATFAQPELDQMLAPIALYPDSLLSQVLMAATYPRDVAEAASWSRVQGGLRGEQAVRAAEDQPWDPSVISLVAFPDVLAMMDERRDWTERLGDAFLAQPDQVMDTVQELRARADAAGNLRSSEELAVQRQGEDYVIEPPSPDYFYVPYYDPRVVYGDWWWSDWPPVFWNPWPGYSYGYRGFGWGPRLYLGGGFFFGAFDWSHRYVRYASHRPWYYRGHDYRGGYRWTRGHDGRDRDGRGRDGRGRAQALRNPDGRNLERRGSDVRGADRRADRRGSPAAAVPSASQGFFKPEPARSTAARPASPRYGSERGVAEGAQRAGTVRSRTVPREGAVPAQRAAVPVQRATPDRGQPSERARTYQRGQRQPAPVRTPVERTVTQRPVPVERTYIQRAPVERPAQAAPVQRSAPAPQRDAPARERADSSRDSSPASRGEGGRGRDR